MEHFDIVQWADFVRGLPESADRTAMEEHLSSGCQACGGAVRQLRKLVAVADAEARYKVPSYAVDYAKSIYPLQQPAKVHIIAHIHTRLIYDSFREPFPRGSAAKAESFAIRATRPVTAAWSCARRSSGAVPGSHSSARSQIRKSRRDKCRMCRLPW